MIPDATGVVTSQSCPAADASAHAKILKYTRALGVPWMVSEFGANDADAEYANEVDWMDASSSPGWSGCTTRRYDPPNAPVQGLLTVDALGGSESNAKQAKLDALVVP